MLSAKEGYAILMTVYTGKTFYFKYTSHLNEEREMAVSEYK
jgi:hypothetical protein